MKDKTNMLRFYFKRIEAGVYILLNERYKIYDAEENFYTDSKLTSEYIEVFISVHNSELKEVRELDVTFVKEAAIKAADDNNEYILERSKEKLKNARELKEPALQVVERLLHYDGIFESALNELLNKFPLPEHHVPMGTKIIG